MITAEHFKRLLAEKGYMVLDGGLATALELTRGHNLDHPLWSGKALRDRPEDIMAVHLNYYLAGAQIAITASYQASTRGLMKHFSMTETEAYHLIKSSVSLAQTARSRATRFTRSNSTLLVAGSVGPYGAYLADGSEYIGDYSLSREQLKDFHRPRIQALIEANVDLLAIETIPSIREVYALLELLREEFPSAIAWMSCTLRSPGLMADGTDIRRLLRGVERVRSQIVAVGINCVGPDMVDGFLTTAKQLTSIPLLCYPNSGEEYEAEEKTWSTSSEVEEFSLAKHAQQWRNKGASIIGGCCRTGEYDISELAQALRTT